MAEVTELGLVCEVSPRSWHEACARLTQCRWQCQGDCCEFLVQWLREVRRLQCRTSGKGKWVQSVKQPQELVKWPRGATPPAAGADIQKQRRGPNHDPPVTRYVDGARFLLGQFGILTSKQHLLKKDFLKAEFCWKLWAFSNENNKNVIHCSVWTGSQCPLTLFTMVLQHRASDCL